MPITYNDIKHRLQPPLDCAEIKDLRGQYFYNRLIINYENADFTGCVLYHCYPSGLTGAIEVGPAQSHFTSDSQTEELLRWILPKVVPLDVEHPGKRNLASSGAWILRIVDDLELFHQVFRVIVDDDAERMQHPHHARRALVQIFAQEVLE